MKTIVTYILVSIVPSVLFGQVSSSEKKGEENMNALAYYSAIDNYENALFRKVDSMKVAGRIAECYEKVGDHQKALEWYAFMERNSTLTDEQKQSYGQLEKVKRDYEAANQLFNQVKNRTDVVENNASITEVEQTIVFNDAYSVHSKDYNTNRSEIGASFVGDKVVFSSNRRKNWVVNRIDTWTGLYFYNLFIVPQSDSVNSTKSKVVRIKWKNSKYHDGPGVFCSENNRYYFTRSERKNVGDKPLNDLNLFVGEINDRKLENVQELNLNSSEYSVAHPAISQDGKFMVFSSNMPGGFGGMDLYFVRLDENGKSIGSPTNLGEKVNTSGNEVFPYYNTSENLLFFSSDGHYGLGGLDVYLARMSDAYGVNSIENLGKPVNSEFDDFSFSMNEEQTRGFFSSARSDNQDDIYGFTLSTPYQNMGLFEGIVLDQLTGSVLSGVTVHVKNQAGEIIQTVSTDSKGQFSIQFEESMNGKLNLGFEKEDYLGLDEGVEIANVSENQSGEFNLAPDLNYAYSGVVVDDNTAEPLGNVEVEVIDLNTNRILDTLYTNEMGQFTSVDFLPYEYKDSVNLKFRLRKDSYIAKNYYLQDLLMQDELISFADQLQLKKIEVGKVDLNDVIDLNPIYFDLGKWDIRPDAALELDKVVELMKENPNMVIELRAHTDSRGSASSNLRLSDRRAKSSAKYIISQGIPKESITGNGYGESRLKYSDKEINAQPTKEEREALHEKNRRTEFIVVRMK